MTWDRIIDAELSGRRPVCSVCRGALVGDGVCEAGCTSCTLVWLHPDGTLRDYSPWSRRQVRGENDAQAIRAATASQRTQGGAEAGQ